MFHRFANPAGLYLALAYTAFYVGVLLAEVRGEIAASKIRAIRMCQAAGWDGARIPLKWRADGRM